MARSKRPHLRGVGFFIAKILEVKKTMRKLLLLFAFLLAGCSLAPTPTPAPVPTATPTPAARYYSKPGKDVVTSLMQQIPQNWVSQSYSELSTDDGVIKEFVLTAVSTGALDKIQVQDWVIDVVWVYHRNASVALYPLIVGVQDGGNYIPYYFRYNGQPARDDYLTYLAEHGILERGRILSPFVRDFVDPKTDIDWLACGSDTFCQVGRYMQETYNLDHAVVSGVIGVDNPIPEGWILAWKWDAATDENTLPEYQKVNLP